MTKWKEESYRGGAIFSGGRCAGPWVVGGDFNVIKYPNERTNCFRINGAMSEFSKCIEEMELVDPPLFEGSYTWRSWENHRSASIDSYTLHYGKSSLLSSNRQYYQR
ncbi:hypothetical protein H5410_016310 [Solanum commersonii]|uniref:Uncharacterized protein n=1 Tax=Solanum commersonii TaxID=4109 RepID=A0A9J5ZW19_SOLCO|nr:hypothetical protein H5410_016310 [Solanum commersonii]